MGPYRYDGHAYFDGMFWPQMLVPWKGQTILGELHVILNCIALPA